MRVAAGAAAVAAGALAGLARSPRGRVALHALRGRPVMYAMIVHLGSDSSIGVPENALVHTCHIDREPPVGPPALRVAPPAVSGDPRVLRGAVDVLNEVLRSSRSPGGEFARGGVLR